MFIGSGSEDAPQALFAAIRNALVAGCMQSLPEFSPPAGENRPMTFRRVLLNTCQEEFEGASEARAVRRDCHADGCCCCLDCLSMYAFAHAGF
jgi:hypothetical protein